MLNMKYCRTENVIAALREWEDDPGTDEHLHNQLYELCLSIAADAGLVPDMTANLAISGYSALLCNIGGYMADITMCRNDLCPMQSCCYRQTAIRSEMQYMANFGYKTDGKTGAFSCDNFWRDESKPMQEGYLHGA